MTCLAATTADLDWPSIAIELVGGLALFLFGMTIMTDALKAIAGGGHAPTAQPPVP